MNGGELNCFRDIWYINMLYIIDSIEKVLLLDEFIYL